MRVLVTGASGYLGSAFADACARRGWSVTRASRGALNEPGWATMPELDGGCFHELPLEVDAVVHFAGIAHLHRDRAPDDATYDRVNGDAVGALAEACRGRARALVFISSVAAVGTGAKGRISPASVPEPTTPYGRSKWLGERRAAAALANGPTSLRVVRLPAVFGRGAPGAVSLLGRWIASRRPVPSGCRMVRRSVISVVNAVDAIATVCERAELDGSTVIPCAHPTPDTLELARHIADAMGTRLRVLPCPRAALRAGSWLLARSGLHGTAIGTGLARLLESSHVEDGTLQATVGWCPPEGLVSGIRRAFAASIDAAEII